MALGVAFVLGRTLYGIGAFDPRSVIVASVVILATGACASLLPAYRATYFQGWVDAFRGRVGDVEDDAVLRFWLQPLTDIHLNAAVDGMEPTTEPIFNYLLVGLALFILLPAVELALLVQVDKLIGFWPTIGLIA